MIKKVCSRCGKPYSGSRCLDCTKKYNRQERANNEVYNKHWNEAREHALSRDNGLCQMCLAENKINIGLRVLVHHIVPIEDDIELRYDSNNLITLCYSHHETVHNKYDSGEKLETQTMLRKLKEVR